MSDEERLDGLGLVDRLQEECVGGATVRLVVDTRVGAGEICVENGQLVHARWRERTGPEALYALLEAARAGCWVSAERSKPVVRSLTGPWRTHLLVALGRFERRDALAQSDRGVALAVRVTREGIAEPGSPATERDAGLVALLGEVAEEVGAALALGRLQWLEAEVARSVWLVAPAPAGWDGVRLKAGADPTAALARLRTGDGAGR